MSAVAGGVAAAALVVIGAFHVLWVRSSWPFATRREFIRDLGGRPNGELPTTFALQSLGVAALLGAAAFLVAAKADLVPGGVSTTLVTVGAWGVAAVLTVRGVAGFVQSGFELGDAPARYRFLDLRVYSPLCLVLSTLIAVAIVSAD